MAEAGGSIVSASGVHRRFGSSEALRGTDFAADAGEITGMVGPNGAGKTTLLLVLATLLAPDAGRVEIAGLDPGTHTAEVRRLVGWVPDSFGFYETLTVREYLGFSGEARLLSRTQAAERTGAVLDLVRLAAHADHPVHALSRGQKQRLAFASVLVHQPAVLLLDEPTAGLDPSSRTEFLRLVRSLADDGTAVVISSHLLGDLEEVADKVVFLDRGVTVGERRLTGAEVVGSARTWRIHALDDDALLGVVTGWGIPVLRTGETGVDLVVPSEVAAAELLTALVGAGVAVVTSGPVTTSLEDTYLQLTESS